MLTKRVVDANGPSHPLLSLDRREHLGRVLEGDGALAERVRYCEEIDESENKSSGIFGDPTSFGGTHKTTGPICSPRLPVVFSRDRPAAKRKMHMRGKV